MKLVHRSRSRSRRAPRIEISDAEILADLTYPASRRAPVTSPKRGEGRRR